MKHLWDFPYASRRSPVFADNVVATSQPLAAQAGLNVLRRGGNAVDAAITTAITLTVVEANNNGLGSDAFALVWDGNQLHGLNASGRSPMAWSPEHFNEHTTMPQAGWDSVTVPGAVSAWVSLSDRFGQLPFAELFRDAIHYAEQGFQLGHLSAFFWSLSARLYANQPGWQQTFAPEGKVPGPADRVRLPDHALSLRKIAESGGEAFYRGDLADAMIRDCIAQGGVMSAADLADHEPDWVKPLHQDYRGIKLHEIPPNGQGLIALIALGILNQFDLSNYALDSVEAVHLQIEAIRQAYAVAERQLADQVYMNQQPVELLNPSFLNKLAQAIDLQQASDILGKVPSSPDTVYLTTADKNGMMVSMIQSNYRGFGSGIVVPGTGISLQNRGSGFTLEEGHPNQVGPGKRPYHTIIPGFVTRDNQPLMSFGVMGGHMQAQGHVQMVVRIFDYQQNPQAASDAPRWHLTETGELALEKGFDPEIARKLADRGHKIRWDDPYWIFGGAQLITRLDEGYCAASDHRKEGMATGF